MSRKVPYLVAVLAGCVDQSERAVPERVGLVQRSIEPRAVGRAVADLERVGVPRPEHP